MLWWAPYVSVVVCILDEKRLLDIQQVVFDYLIEQDYVIIT